MTASSRGPSPADTEPAPETEPPVADAPVETAPDATDAPQAPEAGDAADAEGAADSEDKADADAPELSEAQAELVAQRELRARIAERKAHKSGPVDSGTKLTGTAADLLAAVRAVESGEKSGGAFFTAPARPAAPAAPSPAERRAEPAPSSAAAAVPHQAQAPAAPAPEAVAAVRSVLAAGGAPQEVAARAVAELGEQAADVLREDPWQLLSVPGVRPEQADGFARALLGDGCGPGDERRTAALIAWQLERAALHGHTALEASAVLAGLAERSVPAPDEALRQAVADGAVLAFQDGAEASDEQVSEEGDGSDDGAAADASARQSAPLLLGLDRYALAEESLADGLARLAKAGADERWEAAPGPTELTRAIAAHGLVAHTGGEAARAEPVAAAKSAAALGLRALVAVHSEQAARALGPVAVTVAALLSGSAGPGRDEEGALALDLLVVLDAPRLDVECAAALVESLPDGARLLLSGDPGQLGPAGAGQVFADLLAAGVCPKVASRLPDAGPIGELVSGIGIGELTEVAAPEKEVVIVPVRDPGEAVHRTVQLVADSVPRAIGVPTEQTQVVTVAHTGPAGTRALNTALKERLNPGPGRFGGFDPGDRVAYVPAPGRTLPGTVVSADAHGLHLDCSGTAVTVPKERVGSSVRHGWALTAHQAAALRWPAVVVVLPGDAAGALTRPWVYTAFGRAERHLSVVHGVDRALPQAVATAPAQPRTTRLRRLLEGLLSQPS
ncbi:helix-hairpin-helix domain-containing protein [Streptomyces sp. NPDC020412]|uniref:helix-hairpin-helix domain-containing protein n=1 Tax=Streptomyces sp. NPDC020412 TaxID=3365073 RepID=UPI00379ADBC4